MVIQELDLEGLNDALGSSPGLVLVDFWSPFCVPCRGLRRHVERLAGRYGDACRFAAVDVEKHADVAATYEVSGVPTFVLYRDGAALRRLTGTVMPSDIEAALEEAMAA